MRLAQLSDLHLLSDHPRSRSFAAHFVSLHRRLDRPARRAKFVRALAAAHVAGASHVAISGDLTEVGALPEFEVVAEALGSSPFAPEQITLVPGNHDAYTCRDGWQRAFEGPLAPYRRTSVWSSGGVTPVDLGDVVLLPVDTSRYQTVASSFGVFTRETSEAIHAHFARSVGSAAPRVIVQHHPPFPRKSAAWQYIDGLQGWQSLFDLLETHPSLALLHGHTHLAATRQFGELQHARIFGATAVVDDRAEARLRLYEVERGLLTPV